MPNIKSEGSLCQKKNIKVHVNKLFRRGTTIDQNEQLLQSGEVWDTNKPKFPLVQPPSATCSIIGKIQGGLKAYSPPPPLIFP